MLLVFGYNYIHYKLGIYINLNHDNEVTTFMKTDENRIYMERDGQYEPFEIRGVNMGVGIPGQWATDYAIDKETYLRWFTYIQEMGANTVRVYTILHDDFYNAFYEYNTDREEKGEEPLWMIHGVWVNDYIQNSHRDAYDDDFLQTLKDDSKMLVDILHGKRSIYLGRGLGSGSYRNDVSQWVIGYILGVEWEDVTVTYTNHKNPEKDSYTGKYMTTTEDATPFEAMLAEVGDNIIEHETERYGEQKLIAFSNWPTTDPFSYPAEITYFFVKCAAVNVEHITPTENFISGYFASYHVYPYYPDYLNYTMNPKELNQNSFFDAEKVYGLRDIGPSILDYLPGGEKADYKDKNGKVNTYYTYLKALENFHNIPVVISEYGVSTGRGMAQKDLNIGRNQGHMSEDEQGEAIISCYEDIIDAGCAGSCVFTWQDEWFKRTWNTMHSVDLQKTPYWSDYQTNEQYFGLLTFDPGDKESVSYVDGDTSEWSEDDVVVKSGDMSLSMKYDEKFIYMYAEGFDPDKEKIYIPVDTTSKTGSTYCENYSLSFERPCDFVIIIDGKENSRVMVQERYETLRAMYLWETEQKDPYINEVEKDTPVFKPIHLMLQTATPLITGLWQASAETYETGLLEYGNANPEAENFNSLADYIFTDNGAEIRIPWQLLNFSNPSDMMIHDDYYENHGVGYIHIDEMFVGIELDSEKKGRIPMESFSLQGWGKKVSYHERLKKSYYMLKNYWEKIDASA